VLDSSLMCAGPVLGQLHRPWVTQGTWVNAPPLLCTAMLGQVFAQQIFDVEAQEIA
jgi:hypothetical protein